MSEYKTISVPAEVKKELKKAKGDKEWGEFLRDLYKEATEIKKKKSFEKLSNELSEEELENIKKSSKEFRENFKLR